MGATQFMYLNQTAAAITTNGAWNNVAPTSTVFTLNSSNLNNALGQNYIAYLWAEIPGYSKFGSYTGNGSSDGPFVYCGFKPRFVMWKRVDSTSNWAIVDAARKPSNPLSNALFPDGSWVENPSSPDEACDFLSNGFKARNTIYNVSNGIYIFAAFAETPFKYANAR
jgi:hypothetical protein